MDLTTIALSSNLALEEDPKTPATQAVIVSKVETDAALDTTSDTDISTTDEVTHKTTSPFKGLPEFNVGVMDEIESSNLVNDILEEETEIEDLPESYLSEVDVRESSSSVNNILEEETEIEDLTDVDLSEIMEYLSLVHDLLDNEEQALLNDDIQPLSREDLIKRVNNAARFAAKEQAMTAAINQYKQQDISEPVPTSYNIEVYDRGQLIESVVFTFEEVKNIHDRLMNLSEIRQLKALNDELMQDYNELREQIIAENDSSDIGDEEGYNNSDSTQENTETEISADDYVRMMQQMTREYESTQSTATNLDPDMEEAIESYNSDYSTEESYNSDDSSEESDELDDVDAEYEAIKKLYAQLMLQGSSEDEATQVLADNHSSEIAVNIGEVGSHYQPEIDV